MTDVRHLLLRIDAIDNASKVVGNLLKNTNDIAKKKVAPVVAVKDNATKSLKNVSNASKTASRNLSTAGKAARDAGNSASRGAAGVDKLKKSMDSTNKSTKTLSSSVKSLDKNTGNLKNMIGTAITVGTAWNMAKKADEVNSYKQAIRNSIPDIEGQAKALEWVNAALSDPLANASIAQRAKASSSLYRRVGGMVDAGLMSSEFVNEFLELTENQIAKSDIQIDIGAAMEQMVQGENPMEMLKKLVPGTELSTELFSEAAIEAWKEENKQLVKRHGLTNAAIRQMLVMQKGYEVMTADQADYNEEQQRTDAESVRIGNQIENISYQLGTVLEPALLVVAGALSKVSTIMERYPDMKWIIVAATLLAGLSLSAALVVPGLLHIATASSIAGKAIISKLVPALSSVWVALGPIGIALLALSAIMLYLGYRSGTLQKIWDKIKNSEFGKAVGEDLKEAGAYIDKLFDRATELWGFLDPILTKLYKSGALKTALTLVFPPMLIAKLIKMAPDIGKHIDKLKHVIDSINSGIESSALWLESIYDMFRKKIDDVSNWLRNIYDRLKEFVTTLPGSIATKIYDILESLPVIGDELKQRRLEKEEEEAKAGMSDDERYRAFLSWAGSHYRLQGLPSSDLEWLFAFGKKAAGYGTPETDEIIARSTYEKLTINLSTAERKMINEEIAKLFPKKQSGPPTSLAESAPGSVSTSDGGGKVPTSLAESAGWSDEDQASKQEGPPTSMAESAGWGDQASKQEGPPTSMAESAGWSDEDQAKKKDNNGKWWELDSGGQVADSGGVVVHKKEEIVPADVVKGGETVLERIVKMMSGPLPGGDSFDIRIDMHDVRISSDLDLDWLTREMAWRLRYHIEEMMIKRTSGNYQT